MGGIKAEQALRTKLNEDEYNNILDSVNALVKLRQKSNDQTSKPTPTSMGDHCSNGDSAVEVVGKRSTDSLLVTKDYYDENGSSDDSCSTGESVDDDFPGIDAVSMCSNDRRLQIATGKTDKRDKINAIGIKVGPRTGEEDLQLSSLTNPTETNTSTKNIVISRVKRNFDCSESDSKKNIKMNSGIEDGENEKNNNSVDVAMKNDEILRHSRFGKLNHQDVRKSADTCETYSSRNEKTSQDISAKGLHALKIIPDPAEDNGFSLFLTKSASSDKIEDISIQLPWTQRCVEEKCHIKPSFNSNNCQQ